VRYISRDPICAGDELEDLSRSQYPSNDRLAGDEEHAKNALVVPG